MTMLISNTHNITQNCILFTDTCVDDFFNRIDFMKHQVKLCEQKLNQSVNTSDCHRSEGAESVLAEAREDPSVCIIVNNS